MRKMLLVFAHPDDESFSCGGTVAKYADAGWQIDLITATRGEAGLSGPYDRATEKEVGEIRQKELEKAASLLGIHSVTFLGYKDGSLADLNPGELEDKIVRFMHDLVPDVVITFEPNGISNHPDHMKISLSATYAFQKYAKTLLSPVRRGSRAKAGVTYSHEIIKEARSGTYDPFAEPKLYYACMPQSIAEFGVKHKSIPPESFGKPWTGVPDKMVSTVIDITRYKARKVKALETHITQTEDVRRFLSAPSQSLLRQEFFMLRMHGTTEAFMGKNDPISNRL